MVQDLFKAYFDARKNKRNTVNQLEFEMNFEYELFRLASEIQNRTYKVGNSICFIVNNPVKREIFAADFRDRVVHHLIFNRINTLFERKLIRDCYSCRVGMGTSYGIERIQHHMRSVTNNHTRGAYVLKLDIQGYFMSINRQVLYDKVEKIILKAQNRGMERLDEMLFLLREIIFNDPTDGCRVKGNRKEWRGLPNSKSLFHSPPNCGLPIGNLTSQMFSNVYMADFDNYVKRELKMKHYGRYVDDFYFMHQDKQVLLDVRDHVTAYLKENYSLTVHPKKIYLQDVSHGVTFLGAHVKPYRRYVRHRTLGAIRTNLGSTDRGLRAHARSADNERLSLLRSKFNSYLGYLSQFKTYHIRKERWNDCPGFRRYFHCNASYKKIILKEQYRPHLSDHDEGGYSELIPES